MEHSKLLHSAKAVGGGVHFHAQDCTNNAFMVVLASRFRFVIPTVHGSCLGLLHLACQQFCSPMQPTNGRFCCYLLNLKNVEKTTSSNGAHDDKSDYASEMLADLILCGHPDPSCQHARAPVLPYPNINAHLSCLFNTFTLYIHSTALTISVPPPPSIMGVRCSPNSLYKISSA